MLRTQLNKVCEMSPFFLVNAVYIGQVIITAVHGYMHIQSLLLLYGQTKLNFRVAVKIFCARSALHVVV